MDTDIKCQVLTTQDKMSDIDYLGYTTINTTYTRPPDTEDDVLNGSYHSPHPEFMWLDEVPCVAQGSVETHCIQREDNTICQ